MKKTLIISVLCLMAIFESQAQVTFKPGLRGGANFAKITQTESNFRTDFYIGGFGALKLSRLYTLQPEITYTNQGAKDVAIINYDSNTVRDETLTFSYLSFGIINKFDFSDKINFHLGPMLDIEAGNNLYSNAPIDLSFTAGLGFNVTNNFTIEGRIKKGIVDVFNSNYIISNPDSVLGDYNTNFLFQLGLSYSFDIQN